MYRRVSRLLDEMTLACADGTYPRLLARFARMDVLLLDDWVMGKLTELQRHDLLEVLEDCDGDRSTLVASQLPPEEWFEQIGDPKVADAILDRLIHRAYKLNLKGTLAASFSSVDARHHPWTFGFRRLWVAAMIPWNGQRRIKTGRQWKRTARIVADAPLSEPQALRA